MRPRVFLGKFLLRWGKIIWSLPVFVMRPKDLIAYGRIYDFSPSAIEAWSREELIKEGLNEGETRLVQMIPPDWGRRLLLLFGGGGREAITLAKMGFEVTLIDYVPQKVEKACDWGRKFGYKIEGVVQDISSLEAPQNRYDVAACFASMFASLPTRKRRVRLLKKIHSTLVDGGYLICDGLMVTAERYRKSAELVRRILGYATLGNFWYQTGDMLHHELSFMHFYLSQDEFLSEFKEGGFKVALDLNEENADFHRLLLKKI